MDPACEELTLEVLGGHLILEGINLMRFEVPIQRTHSDLSNVICICISTPYV